MLKLLRSFDFNSGAGGQVHRQHARQRGPGPRAAAPPGGAPLRRLHQRRRGHQEPRRQHQDPPHAQHEPRRLEDEHRRCKFVKPSEGDFTVAVKCAL